MSSGTVFSRSSGNDSVPQPVVVQQIAGVDSYKREYSRGGIFALGSKSCKPIFDEVPSGLKTRPGVNHEGLLMESI